MTTKHYFSALRASVRPTFVLASDRLWQVDALRGIAIVMMVVYHLMWDLRGLAGYDIDVYTGFWHIWQQITANLFIGIVGVSLTLSYGRARQKGGKQAARWGKYALRGAVIFTWGVVIGIVTYVFDPSHYVRFGILHLIGVSIIIAYPFLRFRWLNLILGILLLLLGQILPLFGIDNPWLGWLGLTAFPRPAFDYFPLIPWFGVVLIGIFAGNTFFAARDEMASGRGQVARGGGQGMVWLRLMGQNSLLIYLIHQPILITALILSGQIRL